MDTIIFEFLFDLGQSSPLREIAAAFAQWGSLAAAFTIVGYLGWRGSRALRVERFKHTAFALTSAIVARFGLVDLVRLLAPRPRPFVVEAISPLIGHAATPSFPSGHATFLAALAVYFLLVGGREEKLLGWLLLALAVLVGISRVAVGLHWPTDILAGWLVGALISAGVWYLKKRRRDAII